MKHIKNAKRVLLRMDAKFGGEIRITKMRGNGRVRIHDCLRINGGSEGR
jgi:hypothetical protein